MSLLLKECGMMTGLILLGTGNNLNRQLDTLGEGDLGFKVYRFNTL